MFQTNVANDVTVARDYSTGGCKFCVCLLAPELFCKFSSKVQIRLCGLYLHFMFPGVDMEGP